MIPEPGAATPGINQASCILTIPNPSDLAPTPESITPTQLQISCNVHNFKMNDDHMGKENIQGEGHLIYYLDTLPPTAPGNSAEIMDHNMMYITTNSFQVWNDIQPGRHKFYVQVVNNDNTPLNPPVICWFDIEIPADI